MIADTIVAWRSLLTGHTGHGQPLPKPVAESIVRSANLEWPDIEHWTEIAPTGYLPDGAKGSD